MYTIRRSSQFKTDFKKFKNNEKIVSEFKKIVISLAQKEKLAQKYNDHGLT